MTAYRVWLDSPHGHYWIPVEADSEAEVVKKLSRSKKSRLLSINEIVTRKQLISLVPEDFGHSVKV